MSATPHRVAAALLLGACVWLAPSSAFAAAAGGGPALGLLLETPGVTRMPPAGSAPAGSEPVVRLDARRAEVEKEAGVYDWGPLAHAVDDARAAGWRVALRLGGSASPTLEGWLGFVRDAVRVLGDRVSVFEIGDAIGTREEAPAFDAQAYAFLLKQSALAVRAEARALGRSVAVAQAVVPAGALERQRELWARDVAPYIDILPVAIDPAADPEAQASALEALIAASIEHPPAPALWAYAERPSPADPWAAPAAAVAALGRGAKTALFAEAEPPELATEQARWAAGLQSVLASGYEPAPIDPLRLLDTQGAVLPGGRVLAHFFRLEDPSDVVVYRSPTAGAADGTRWLVIDSPVVRNARIVQPSTGKDWSIAPSPAPGGGSARALPVLSSEEPLVALFDKQAAAGGVELPPEAVAISSHRSLTAEEIIAHHQEVQREQDHRLHRWTARGRIDFHFKLAQAGSTVDVSIDCNYFWEEGAGIEWEQTDYYVNGNKVRWKNIPELPLIQPEKVITLPLDLTLDKTYAYRLIGESQVDGREAYELEFQPADPDAPLSLYRGRVWIDKQSFVRLQASVLQTRLEPPILSNEELDRYAPESDLDGMEYWMLSSIDGQQIWTVAGRSLVVRRELTFKDFEVNPPREEFERRRNAAYASSHQMLRDTDQGFRYLERQEDGSRQVKETVDTSQLFAAAGALKDSSTEGVTPLAGVNYFDYDVAGRKIQMNALFAGVLGLFTASKADLLGGHLDVTLDAAGLAIRGEDKVFLGDDELGTERIRNRAQHIALRLGLPLGQFWKFSLVTGLAFRDYARDDDAATAIEAYETAHPSQRLGFQLPPDHRELRRTFELEFNRRGYTVSGSATRAGRSEWSAWGAFDPSLGQSVSFDPATGTYVPAAPEPIEPRFSRWDLKAFKEWYLPAFQKVRGEVNVLDGSRLDRFSRYQFSLFGDTRLNGFAGSGVRFDQGWIARTGYSFNLFEALRFDASLETARVEEEGTVVGRQSFTGIGLSGNVVGPWKTVVNLSYGRALASDIPDLEGEQEFLLLILKLF